jgi:hypothetical protein
MHRDPVLPTVTAGETVQKGNSNPLIENRKEVIGTTTRTLKRATYPAYPSLRNPAGAPGEKSQPQLLGHKN